MKVSLNWAQQESNVALLKNPEDLITKIGAQLGEIDNITEWGPRYEGIVVVKVVECSKHPNADKLSLCLVDDNKTTKNVARNDQGLVQVVCGAPNVKAGMLTAWIPPGVTVPSTVGKDPLVLEARDLRGKISNGMLASLSELNISEDHNGILEIVAEDVGKDNARPGTPLKMLYNLDDTVVDIENKMFTHRPDCFGLLGVARELAGIQHLAFKSPDWYLQVPQIETGSGLPLTVKVEDSKLVSRFMAVAVSNIKVGPSPVSMQAALTRVGIRPINNVVDITNYCMYVTGQPLHAYDYDKVKALSGAAPKLIARQAKAKETVQLLNGKTVALEAPAIVIATDKQAIGIAGVIGGSQTAVDVSTTNIILECANFNMYNIRRTSMKYGLFTEAVTRFNKGQSIHQTDRVLAHAMTYLEQFSKGKPASKVFDIGGTDIQSNSSVAVTADFINVRLGTKLSLTDISKLLENVEFKITTVPADRKKLHITPPFWRTDIAIPEDIVEEVGRLYGYDHLPLKLPKRDLTPAEPHQLMAFTTQLRQLLASAGANELLTYSFVDGDLLQQVEQDAANAYELSNAISPDLQYLRMSIVPNLLNKVRPNLKQGYNEFAIFEMGTVHNKDQVDDDKLPIEEKRLGLVFAADKKTALTKYAGAPYYQLYIYLNYLLSSLGIPYVLERASNYEPKVPVGQQAIAPFERSRAVYVKTPGGALLGEMGELKANVRRRLKLPDFVAAMELDVERLLEHAQATRYQPLSRFPKVEQDLSLKIPAKVSYQELRAVVEAGLNENAPEDTSFTLRPVDIYQDVKDDAFKHITLRLAITAHDRTLKTAAVNQLLDTVAVEAANVLLAERI